jgi:hypothetical protein
MTTKIIDVKPNEFLLLSNFIEVKFLNENGYRVVRETIARICTKVDDQYTQECFLYHRRNKYYIVHWSEMFALDNKDYTYINERNLRLRNKIARLLVKYNLIKIINDDNINEWVYIDVNSKERMIVIYDGFLRFKVLSFEESRNNNIKIMEW